MKGNPDTQDARSLMDCIPRKEKCSYQLVSEVQVSELF